MPVSQMINLIVHIGLKVIFTIVPVRKVQCVYTTDIDVGLCSHFTQYSVLGIKAKEWLIIVRRVQNIHGQTAKRLQPKKFVKNSFFSVKHGAQYTCVHIRALFPVRIYEMCTEISL